VADSLRYVSYDAAGVWKLITDAYLEAGGDPLYPGDEKEMLLRSVQAVAAQVLASVDTALKMQTLRYALGDYLDIIGDNRACARMEATQATGRVRITMQPTGLQDTLPEGTAMTVDGNVNFELAEDVAVTGFEQVSEAAVRCQTAGVIGNAVAEGTPLQLLAGHPAVVSIVLVEETGGGQDREGDESYRERIRLSGMGEVTTGPATQYEAAARAVSSRILDAKASRIAAGQVGVALLLDSDEGAAAVISAVESALNDENVRPLTDQVTVGLAVEKTYTMNVEVTVEAAGGGSALSEAVTEWQQWQGGAIGRAFNPDRLMSMLYTAGAVRVRWLSGSGFDGGDAVYTPVAWNAHCMGEVTLTTVQGGE
jgi:phage-related baseplate assembly protein